MLEASQPGIGVVRFKQVFELKVARLNRLPVEHQVGCFL
jgi:hypothetical protein